MSNLRIYSIKELPLVKVRISEHLFIEVKTNEATAHSVNFLNERPAREHVKDERKVMDDEYLYDLRNEFRNYIRQQHPEWADSTVDMHKSDAFFLENNDVGISLTEALVNEASLLVARDKIRDYLRDVNRVGDPQSGANGYLRTLRMFREFLSARTELNTAVTIETQEDTPMCDKINTHPRRVDFRNTSACAGCDPIMCVICGENIDVGTWRDILVTLTEKFLRENYPNVNDLYARPLLQGSTRPFLLAEEPNGAARRISTGHWIYVNLSIADLVDLIGKLCRFCGVNLQDVKITYIPKGNNNFLCNEKSDRRESALTVPRSVIDVLFTEYATGFRFDKTAIRLLSSKSGFEVDDALQAVLKQQMFSRGDEIYFLPDVIADEDTRKGIVCIADEFLDEYGCFEISELYALFEDKLNGKYISNADDFEKFYEFINTRNVRCVAAPLIGNRIARLSNGSVWSTFNEVADKIVTITYNEYGGTVIEDDLHSRFCAFSTDLLAKIIKSAAEELVRTEINGIVVYQTLDALGLTDDFSDTLHNTLNRLDDLGIALSVEALHTALSLAMDVNFNVEFNILDKATYQRLIAAYYKAEPPREWKGGIFSEVSI